MSETISYEELFEFAETVYYNTPYERNQFDSFEEMWEFVSAMQEKGYNPQVLREMIAVLPLCGPDCGEASAGMAVRAVHPSHIIASAADKNRKRHLEFPKLPEDMQNTLDDIQRQLYASHAVRRKSKKRDIFITYQQNLEEILHIYKSIEMLPEKTGQLFTDWAAKPAIQNDGLYAIQMLFGVIEGGLYDSLSKANITSKEWLSAIELALAIWDPDLMNQLADSDFKETLAEDSVIDEIGDMWPTVLCLGILIHNLNLFTDDTSLARLYEKNYEPNKDASERKELRRQIQEAKAESNSLRKTVQEQKNKISILEKKAAASPQKGRDVTALVHQHNQELREKDNEILQLQEMVSRLEQERAALEHRIMKEAESAMDEKPWLNLELPEDGIIFIGGHQNMTKRLWSKYPKWTFIEKELGRDLPVKAEAIFIWSDHLSHPLWYKLNQAYHGREKMVYLEATNISRLEEEMKFGLWKLRQDNHEV